MQKAIVIGASSGIGKQLATLLLNDDFKVGITGRRLYRLKEFNKNYHGKIVQKGFDISEADNSKELRKLTKELGGLDMLVFCAGCEARNPALEYSKEKNSVSTNVNGFIEIINWALRYFVKQGHGQIIALSSLAGLRGGRIAPSYNASKAFQINYLEGLRQLVRKMRLPIFITDIRPGFVDTDLANKDVMFWDISPEKAGKLIYKAIKRKPDIAYIPVRWWFFVILLRLTPNWIYKRL